MTRTVGVRIKMFRTSFRRREQLGESGIVKEPRQVDRNTVRLEERLGEQQQRER